ncbi:peptidase M14 [Niallia nealsonii]|uniref:Peptidase M14 n=2 Tax=Niallia nealsonii TaxID=115979 RepID=A0A2N0Z2Q6_9BACI|nr:peptidase M14 [Niallia nealsonii]
MVEDIKKLQKSYPSLIAYKVIGKSEYGRDIYAVSLGKGTATTFINGSHHAREWLTTNLNMYMLEQYAISYQKKTKINGYDTQKILANTKIWFVPMVNPDGVTLQQQGLKAFPKSAHAGLIKMNDGSKNFKRWKANAKGIDLNRQYDAGWKNISNNAKGPSYSHYKGKTPASAKEVKAILSFVNSINPEMSVAYHTSGKILYWNYKQTTHYKRDLAYAKKIGKMTGYSLVYSGKNPSGGGFTDWFIQTKKRPGFTPEISKYYKDTNPPISEFAGSWKENKGVGLYVAQESYKLYDNRKKTEKDKLEKELKTIQASARNLKKYYSTNIKSEKNLTISKAFTNDYNKVKNNRKRLESKSKKLPLKYQNQLAGYYKEINKHLEHSDRYFAMIKQGDILVKDEKDLVALFKSGTMTTKTVASSEKLAKSIGKTDSLINKTADSRIKKLAQNKYTKKAKATKKNTDYEINRYKVSNEMEEELNKKQIAAAKRSLATLNKVEKDSKTTKTKEKYVTYQKVENYLAKRKQTLEQQLKDLEEEQQKDVQTETAS